MDREPNGQGSRCLRLTTGHGHVEGRVRMPPRITTLRYLNVTGKSRSFIVMAPPIEPSDGWNIVDGSLALAIDSVLFVEEVSEHRPVPEDPAAAALYERRHVRLNVGEYAVEGFLHMPPGGDPITRLNSDPNAFFALSAASAIGPERQFATPFLAIRRAEVIALQAVGKESVLKDDLEAEVVSRC